MARPLGSSAARCGFASRELLASAVLFAAGVGLGVWALGGVDSAEARQWVARMSERAGVRLEALAAPTPADGSAPAAETAPNLHPDEAERSHFDDELEPMRHELAALNRARTAALGPPDQRAAPRGEATLEFWNQLNAVLAREAAMRQVPAEITSATASGFIAARTRAATFATAAIRRLDPREVDPQVVALADDIADWYDEGARLNREAQALLEADEATRRGSRAHQWKAGEKKHRQRCLDLNEAAQLIRQRMSQQYALAFPPLE